MRARYRVFFDSIDSWDKTFRRADEKFFDCAPASGVHKLS